MTDDRLADVTTFLLDGLADEPSYGELWITDDRDRLEGRLAALAFAILDGKAPPEFAGRRVIVTEAPTLLASSREEADGRAFTARVIDELEASGAALGIRDIDLLVDSGDARLLLDDLLDAVRDGRVGCFLGFTDGDGFERISSTAPRLPGLCRTLFLDDDPPSFQLTTSLVKTSGPTDRADRGWIVAVRCHLTAPAPALAALASGSMVLDAGGVGALDDDRVDDIWCIQVRDGTVPALMVSLEPEAATADDGELADEIALEAVRTLIWRALRDDERVDAVRRACFQ